MTKSHLFERLVCVDDDVHVWNRTVTNKFYLRKNNLDFGESGLESFSNLQGEDSGLRVDQPANLDDSVLGGLGGDDEKKDDDDGWGGGGGGGQSFLQRNNTEQDVSPDKLLNFFAQDWDAFDAQSDNLSSRSQKRRKMDWSYPAGYQAGGSSSSSSSSSSAW